MAALPSNVGYGTVTGQFILGVADTAADTDALPEAVPAVGSIVFSPLISYVPDAAARVVLVPQPVTVTLDSLGYIVSPGNSAVRAVTLIASDNDAFNPRDWAWRATFKFQNVSSQIPIVDFVVRAGVAIDLATYVPAPTAPVLGTAQLTALAASAENYAALAAASAAAAASGGGGGGGGSTFPASSSYVYDSAGNVTKSTEDGVVTTYTYHPDGSLWTDTRGGVTRTYTYDGSGNLITIAS